MRTREEIIDHTYKDHLTTVEVLLDIREELIKNRNLCYLAMAPNLSDKAQLDLARRISKAILKKENNKP